MNLNKKDLQLITSSVQCLKTKESSQKTGDSRENSNEKKNKDTKNVNIHIIFFMSLKMKVHGKTKK